MCILLCMLLYFKILLPENKTLIEILFNYLLLIFRCLKMGITQKKLFNLNLIFDDEFK